jgi:DNA-binding NtrC family response regulator
LRTVERAHVQRVLDAVGWNKKKAARVLEISRETLYRKIAEYSLSPAVARDRAETADAEVGGPQWAA